MKTSSAGRIPSIGLAVLTSFPMMTLAAAMVDSQNQPILRVTTRLVVVNVVVRDKKGAPVEGLTRDHFTLLDGDRPQKISVFSVKSGRTLQQHLQVLPLNTYSNRISRKGDLPTSATVILLDGLNTRFEDRVYAREQLVRFLSQLQPQDRVAIYVLGRDRLNVLQDFTSDPVPLLEALEHYRGTAAEPATPSAADVSAHSPGVTGPAALAASRLDATMSILEMHSPLGVWNAYSTDATIEAIAQHLSGFPGRKSIIWLTGNVPAPGPCGAHMSAPGSALAHPSLQSSDSNGLAEFKYWHMVRALNQDDVAVYPVDARGLFTDPAYNAENRSPPGMNGAGARLAAMYCLTAGMLYLAQQTGGEAFHDTNDLKNAIRKALDDSELTYTLGYYPDHGRWDGSYRKIKIRVDVKGAELRYRQGYFALADAAVQNSKDRVALLKDAAEDPLEDTAIGVTVCATPFRDSHAEELEVKVSVDGHDLRFQQANGRWTGSVDVWMGQYSSQGRSLRAVLKTGSGNWNDEEYRQVLQHGLTITSHQRINLEAQELRVVVRDGLSGELGSVRIPLRELSEQRTAPD